VIRSIDTEQKIVQAALELFVRKGYHGTSIADITTKVGLTKGALYAHFTGKGDLLLRLIEEFKAGFVGGMADNVRDCPGDALDRLNWVISFNAKFAAQHEDLCVFLTFLTTELNADVDFRPALKEVYRQYAAIISELIGQGIRQGLFKKELDPRVAALAFMALHDGVLHQWALNRNQLDGTQYVRTFREIFLYGLVREGVRESRKMKRHQVQS
jgi:AcrR family transcriptional regulator